MSLAVTHFAFGAAMTMIVVWAVAPVHRYRTTLAVLGGLWALVPDLHYVLSPGFAGAVRGIKWSIFGDMFWFHATLDGLIQGEGTRIEGALSLALLLIVAAASEWSGHSTDPDESECGSQDSVGS